MASNKLKLQHFRTNDLIDDSGKQFELGKSWCDDFFEFDENQQEVVVNLYFKATQMNHASLNNKIIELKLAGVSIRGDRKAYANGTNGMSQIKDFFINELHLTPERNLQDYFAIYKYSEREYFLYFVPSILYNNFLQYFKSELPTVSINHDNGNSNTNEKQSLQQIFYGAPGTGKSNTIKKEVDDKNLPCIRTTFHPDSDYSTFVGAYKPSMKENVISKNGVETKDEQIVYRFVPQAFLKAYIGAWKNQDEPFFLIIEEINRGNCAQIFGDLFQLLDRNDSGDSEYPISPDEDIQKFLLTDKKYGFAALTEEQKAAIPEEIKNGELLKLPKNLHIWATMNTSDQSLFPIDSAFKRRWDWQYMPISDGMKGWKIVVKGVHYDWWKFLQKINDEIGSKTNSEDKKLGYFFCKPTDGVITAETFVSKVIFYIWNDVFKDFAEEAGNLFKDVDNTLLSFNKFYQVGRDGKTMVVEEKVIQFLQNLGVEPLTEEDGHEEDGNSETMEGNMS